MDNIWSASWQAHCFKFEYDKMEKDFKKMNLLYNLHIKSPDRVFSQMKNEIGFHNIKE